MGTFLDSACSVLLQVVPLLVVACVVGAFMGWLVQDTDGVGDYVIISFLTGAIVVGWLKDRESIDG
jgi:hypothetical protein